MPRPSRREPSTGSAAPCCSATAPPRSKPLSLTMSLQHGELSCPGWATSPPLSLCSVTIGASLPRRVGPARVPAGSFWRKAVNCLWFVSLQASYESHGDCHRRGARASEVPFGSICLLCEQSQLLHHLLVLYFFRHELWSRLAFYQSLKDVRSYRLPAIP